MIVILSSIVAFWDCIKKKSSIVFYITFILLWILMAFTYGNADESIYLSRYYNWEIWKGQTEILFQLLMKTFVNFNIPYQFYKAIIVFIEMLLISCTVKKYSKYPNLVMILYFLFPFTIDIAQMRNTLAMSIMIYFSQFLLNDSEQKHIVLLLTKNELIFLLGIVIATCIHTASIIWILLLFASKFDLKKVTVFTIIFAIIFSSIITPHAIIWISSKFGAEARIGAYVSTAYEVTRQKYFFGAMIRVIIYAIQNIGLCLLLLDYNKHNKKQIIFILKCNIIILCIIPIIMNYTNEVYRMQVGLSILNYIGFTNCMDGKYEGTHKTSLNNFIIFCALVIICFINLYLLILRNNYHSVFLPVFSNNVFFDLFK